MFLFYLIVIPDNKNMFNFVKNKRKSYSCRIDVFIKIIITRGLFMQNKYLYRISSLYEKRIETTGESLQWKHQSDVN